MAARCTRLMPIASSVSWFIRVDASSRLRTMAIATMPAIAVTAAKMRSTSVNTLIASPRAGALAGQALGEERGSFPNISWIARLASPDPRPAPGMV